VVGCNVRDFATRHGYFETIVRQLLEPVTADLWSPGPVCDTSAPTGTSVRPQGLGALRNDPTLKIYILLSSIPVSS
jgi:hypothetical protein